MVERHSCRLHNIERLFVAEHRYFKCYVDALEHFRLHALYFASYKQRDFLRWCKAGQLYGVRGLLDSRRRVSSLFEFGQHGEHVLTMAPTYARFGAQCCFMNLFGNFGGQVRQAQIVFAGRVWRVTGKKHFVHTQAVGGAQKRADIVAAPQIVGNEHDFSHLSSLRRTDKTTKRKLFLGPRLCFNMGMSQDARLDEEQATLRRARLLNMSYADTSQVPNQNKVIYEGLLPKEDLYKLRIIPLQADKNNILFGVTTTTSQQTMNGLRQRFVDQNITYALISEAGYREYMRLYDPPKKVEYQDIAINTAGSEQLVQTVSQMLDQVRADDMLAYLVQQAHRLNASDIHIETQTDHVRIRFRIDGVLHPIARLSGEKYRILLSAIASAGDVSTGVDQAQQGHIAQHIRMADGSEVDVNVRLETVPTINGIDVVMRLFNMDSEKYTLDRLGLSQQERKVVDDIIAKPSGLVMVVGPTGSGKTTTLYSMLNTLKSDERKIITVEDPVEYQFPGITQIPVHSSEGGNDDKFADKLRAILRLDPDIVMVGEIRDNDTARTALQASLTGHLVLSTFHASSAAAALTRLMDVIGQNPLFVSAIRLVMAQRLVRRLDETTKQQYEPDLATLEQIQKVVETLPPNMERPNLQGLKLYKPGTSEANPYGFTGQLAVREQFMMTGEIRRLLEQTKTALSTQEIEAAAIQSGMRTMLQDGVLKVIAGETTLEEVFRVVG